MVVSPLILNIATMRSLMISLGNRIRGRWVATRKQLASTAAGLAENRHHSHQLQSATRPLRREQRLDESKAVPTTHIGTEPSLLQDSPNSLLPIRAHTGHPHRWAYPKRAPSERVLPCVEVVLQGAMPILMSTPDALVNPATFISRMSPKCAMNLMPRLVVVKDADGQRPAGSSD